VVGLQRRFKEAEEIARQELTEEQAKANLAYLRSMLVQKNARNALRNKAAAPHPGGSIGAFEQYTAA